jgi:hypothetical protein
MVAVSRRYIAMCSGGIMAKAPGKKTIRSRLRKKRRQIAASPVVTPDAALGEIVGHEPRTREEIVLALHAYARNKGLVHPSGQMIEANSALRELSYGKEKIHAAGLKRVVTLHVSPHSSMLSWRVGTIGPGLAGDPITSFDRRMMAGDSGLDGDPMTPFRKRPRLKS